MFAKRCLLPDAVSMRQKALCCAAGVTATGFTLVSALYAFIYWDDRRHESKPQSYLPSPDFQYEVPKEPTKAELQKQARRDLMASVILGISGVATGGATGFVASKDIFGWFSEVRGETRCCNIIRNTAFTCLRLPVYAVFFGLAYGMWHDARYKFSRSMKDI